MMVLRVGALVCNLVAMIVAEASFFFVLFYDTPLRALQILTLTLWAICAAICIINVLTATSALLRERRLWRATRRAAVFD